MTDMENSTYSSDKNSVNDGIYRYASFGPISGKKGRHFKCYKCHIFELAANGGIMREVKGQVKIPKCSKKKADEVIKKCLLTAKMCQKYKAFWEEWCDVQIRFALCMEAGMDDVCFLNASVSYCGKGGLCSRQLREDEVVIIEEKIRGQFQTFIDVDGAIFTHNPHLEALVHKSWSESGGENMLLGIKGVELSKRGQKCFHLSTPCMASRDNNWGPNDRGQGAIQRFFKQHKCSNICVNLRKPSHPTDTLYPSVPVRGRVSDKRGKHFPPTPSPEKQQCNQRLQCHRSLPRQQENYLQIINNLNINIKNKEKQINEKDIPCDVSIMTPCSYSDILQNFEKKGGEGVCANIVQNNSFCDQDLRSLATLFISLQTDDKNQSRRPHDVIPSAPPLNEL